MGAVVFTIIVPVAVGRVDTIAVVVSSISSGGDIVTASKYNGAIW